MNSLNFQAHYIRTKDGRKISTKLRKMIADDAVQNCEYNHITHELLHEVTDYMCVFYGLRAQKNNI